MKKLLIALLTVVALHADANASTPLSTSDSLTTSKNYVALEIDPTPFMFGGYSFSLKYSPAGLNRLSIMGSIYSSNLPDNLLSKANYDNGFRDVKLNTSYALFIDYFLSNKNRTGFHFGPSVFLYNKTIGFVESSQKLDFTSVYPNVRFGYVWKPFAKTGFYLNPWFNVGKEFFLSEQKTLNGIEYKTSAINYVVAIHLGYKVNF